jgi:hypothetical protein
VRAVAPGRRAITEATNRGHQLTAVVRNPTPMLDPDGERTGNYRTAPARLLDTTTEAPLFRYADLAVAIVDEARTPRHHRTLLAAGC